MTNTPYGHPPFSDFKEIKRWRKKKKREKERKNGE
jgi:hypothetical protein